MKPLSQEEFNMYWNQTEILRSYHMRLSVFGDMGLPYIFISQHHLKDRAFVYRGTVFIQQPTLILPFNQGPQFNEGFDVEMPEAAMTLFRNVGIPYSNIRHQVGSATRIEYGELKRVLEQHYERMEKQEDAVTGLLLGNTDGKDVSLMKYALVLSAKSAPGNISEILKDIKLQGGDISGFF